MMLEIPIIKDLNKICIHSNRAKRICSDLNFQSRYKQRYPTETKLPKKKESMDFSAILNFKRAPVQDFEDYDYYDYEKPPGDLIEFTIKLKDLDLIYILEGRSISLEGKNR